ncbi:MAG: hypothetical protein ACRD4H_05630, partial [Candidatus Acidiferrales bacterium]
MYQQGDGGIITVYSRMNGSPWPNEFGRLAQRPNRFEKQLEEVGGASLSGEIATAPVGGLFTRPQCTA